MPLVPGLLAESEPRSGEERVGAASKPHAPVAIEHPVLRAALRISERLRDIPHLRFESTGLSEDAEERQRHAHGDHQDRECEDEINERECRSELVSG